MRGLCAVGGWGGLFELNGGVECGGLSPALTFAVRVMLIRSRSMLQRGRGAVIALERRVNFDAASLRIASTGYAQFHSYLCHNFAAHVTANARQSCGRVTGFSGCDESCCRSWVPRDSEAVELLHRCREPTTCSRSFVARRLALDGPHSVKRYFRYERTPRLELWQIYHDMKNKH